MRSTRLAAAVLVLVAAAACAGRDTDPTPSTTTITRAAQTAEGIANAGFDAWRAGDEAGLLEIATPVAAARMFAIPGYASDGLVPKGCAADETDVLCTWGKDATGAELTIRVAPSTDGLEITDARYTSG